MSTLILTVLFGLVLAFFATQNTNTTAITFANYRFTNIPLYMIVIGSILVGLFVSGLISLLNTISANMKLHSKNKTIKEAQSTINILEEKVHEVELENAHLKGENDRPVVIEKTAVHTAH